MTTFPVHTPGTAPEGSKTALEQIATRYGFIPNLAAVFAESPGAMQGLLGVLGAYDAEAISLTPLERQVVLLAVSVRNKCAYCSAAHSMLAEMSGLATEEVYKLQDGVALADSKLQSLRVFAEILVDKRGWAAAPDVAAFLAAGYAKGAVLEVILGIAVKTLTNYANHIAQPPVNEQFARFLPQWAKAA